MHAVYYALLRGCVRRMLISCLQSYVIPDARLQAFKKRFRAPAVSRKIVRRCTKTVRGSKSKFDPRYNSWCKTMPTGETGGAVAGGSGTGLATCELDGSSESDGEDEAMDSDDDDVFRLGPALEHVARISRRRPPPPSALHTSHGIVYQSKCPC